MSRTITLILIFLTNNCLAQKVTNITAEQVGQTIQVSFNLEAESPCAISLFYSIDYGASWQGPLKKVSGDVGEKVNSGNKKITWDVLNEMEQLKISSVVFKVDARKPGLKEVKIGNQIWSAENLNVDRYSNGDIIPQVTDATAWRNLASGAWCYNNDSIKGSVYGKLYNWYSVADPRGLCPIGWHVPSDAEWTTLSNYWGGSSVAGGQMKETGLTHWASPNTGATNYSGFTGLPGGCRHDVGSYNFIGNDGYWWSTTQQYSAKDAYYRYLGYNYSAILSYSANKTYGFSVRCIKD